MGRKRDVVDFLANLDGEGCEELADVKDLLEDMDEDEDDDLDFSGDLDDEDLLENPIIWDDDDDA